MLNSVSFGTRQNLYDKPNVDAPQAHQRPQAPVAPQEAPKKNNHTAAKVIGGIVAAAAIAVGLLAFGSKQGYITPEKIKKIIPDKLLNAEFVSNIKEPVKNGIKAVSEFGTKIADSAIGGYEWVAGKCSEGFEAVKNLFGKKEAAATIVE